MHRILTSIALTAAALALVGCGGGGGGGSTVAVTPSIAGTWSVPSLGLPQDHMMIGSGGEVFVESEATTSAASSTRASTGCYKRIGTCSTTGSIAFNGSWIYGGSSYTILGSGAVNNTAHTVAVVVTLTKDNRIVLQNAPAAGSLADDTPPPVPDFPEDDNGGFDPPPPIPSI